MTFRNGWCHRDLLAPNYTFRYRGQRLFFNQSLDPACTTPSSRRFSTRPVGRVPGRSPPATATGQERSQSYRDLVVEGRPPVRRACLPKSDSPSLSPWSEYPDVGGGRVGVGVG